jgi:beta-N-acetylhexosaminidase
MPSHLRVPELTGDLPATVSAAALGGLLRGELGFTGVIVSDALEMRAVRDRFGVPGAAVLAVAAGTDLLCLGRDSDETEYLAVRSALVDAVRDGTISGTRLEDAAGRLAAGSGVAADGVGLAAARRAVRVSGPRATLSRPLIIEVEPLENIAAGRFGWGLGPWAPAGSVRRVNAGDDEAAAILAAAAGRSLVAVVRDAHRDANTRSLVSAHCSRPGPTRSWLRWGCHAGSRRTASPTWRRTVRRGPARRPPRSCSGWRSTWPR